MRISGGSITPLDIKILPSFRPRTKLGLKWVELADGNYGAVDRGSACDIYESDVTIYGVESVIQNFFTAVQLNRADGTHVFALSQFNDGEKIFGADIDYSGTIEATIIKMNRKSQKTWKGFSLSFTLRAKAVSFTGTASLPTLKPLIGYDGDSSFTVDKRDSYFGDLFFSDLDKDSGTFSAVYNFTNDDMMAIRRYIATQRAATISISALAGVTKPFGNRVASFPLSVKIINWDDLGMIAWGISSDVRCWALQMTLAEVV